jgi:hypothetical protein
MAERRRFVKGKDENKRGSVLFGQSPKFIVKLTVSAFLTFFLSLQNKLFGKAMA